MPSLTDLAYDLLKISCDLRCCSERESAESVHCFAKRTNIYEPQVNIFVRFTFSYNGFV
jgi:hypothetical protein